MRGLIFGDHVARGVAYSRLWHNKEHPELPSVCNDYGVAWQQAEQLPQAILGFRMRLRAFIAAQRLPEPPYVHPELKESWDERIYSIQGLAVRARRSSGWAVSWRTVS